MDHDIRYEIEQARKANRDTPTTTFYYKADSGVRLLLLLRVRRHLGVLLLLRVRRRLSRVHLVRGGRGAL